MSFKPAEINYYNPNLKIKYLSSFKIDAKYKEDIDFFQHVINECHLKGYDALKKYNSKKFKSSQNIYKIYAKLYGHRMSFVYASDIDSLKDNPDYKNTVIFIKYTSQHDKQEIDAKRAIKSVNDKANFIDAKYELELDVDEDEKLNNYDFSKTFCYNGNSGEFKLSPNFDEIQKSLIQLPRESMIIKGVAGSGKTSICIELFRKLALNGKKALYVTFSGNLVSLAVSEKLLFADNIETIIKNLENNVQYQNLPDYITNELRFKLKSSKKEDIIKELKQILKNLDKIDIKTFTELSENPIEKKSFADEKYFIDFIKENNCAKDYNLKAEVDNLKISYELLFKEIYGIVFGYLLPDFSRKNAVANYVMNEKEYLWLDNKYTSYSVKERTVIYKLAQKYLKALLENNRADNNIIAFNLLKEKINKKYDYVIIDEIQDLSELQILYLTKLGTVLFCVGDINQMVNPNYFDFNRAKELIGAAKVTDILKTNYRSSAKIVRMLNDVTLIKQEKLGRWSNYDTIEQTMGDEVKSELAFSHSEKLLESICSLDADNYDIIVADKSTKDELVAKLNAPNVNKKIMTVAEVKGLDKDFIIVYDILSGKENDWKLLNQSVSKKGVGADANSKYRYIFNLFYVALTRTQNNICIIETKSNEIFTKFFEKDYFVKIDEKITKQELIQMFDLRKLAIVEWKERYDKAIADGDYEKAYIYADTYIKEEIYIKKAEVYVSLASSGDNFTAADKLCDLGFYSEARVLYIRAGKQELADFMKLLSGDSSDEFSTNKILKIYFTTSSSKIKERVLGFYKNMADEIDNKTNAVNALLKKLEDK